MPLILTTVEKHESKQLIREHCDHGEPAAEHTARSILWWGIASSKSLGMGMGPNSTLLHCPAATLTSVCIPVALCGKLVGYLISSTKNRNEVSDSSA